MVNGCGDLIHIDYNSHNGKNYKMKGESVRASDTKRFIKASYDKVKDAEKNINGYILDTKLSTAEAKVYHNPTTNKTIVANRGTKGLTDWGNNALYGADLATGGLFNLYTKSDRFQNAKDTQKKAIDKYGKVETNIGHSQSGIITRKLNKKGLTGEVINANPATFFDKSKKNETNIRSTFDPVSMFNRDATTIKYNTLNPLDAHSTKFMDSLGDKYIGKGFKNKSTTNVMTSKEHEANIIGRMKELAKDIHIHRKMHGRKPKIIKGFKMLGEGISKSYDSDTDPETDSESSDSSSDDEEMTGGKISRSKKFNKWMKNLGGVTKSVGEYIKPVAKPIFEAGTKAAVSKIAGMGMEGGKISRSKKFNKWMKNLGGVTKSVGEYIKPVAKPIFEAGTKLAVSKIAGMGMDGCGIVDDIKKVAKSKAGKAAIKTGKEMAIKALSGSGVKKGRMKKGSPEAIAFGEKMKALRASKK